MAKELAVDIVTLLAKRYGFDAEEALNGIENVEEVSGEEVSGEEVSGEEVSGVKKCAKVAKIPLPWVGVVNKKKCKGLRYNHGLHTQCRHDAKDLCKQCARTNAPYGRVEDRMKTGLIDFVDKKGKKTIPYINVANKLNISMQEAERQIQSLFGCTIPEEHKTLRKTRRGRPKKNTTIVTDTDSDPPTPKKKRGRPKKEKKIMRTVGDDLIDDIIASATQEQLALANQQVSTLSQTILSYSNKILSNMDELVSNLTKPTPTTPTSSNPIPDEDDDDSESEDCEEFEWEGVKYWKTDDGTLYHPETHEEMGIYDPDEHCVTLH